MKIRLIPKSRRAKNRVAEHGNQFTLMREENRNGKKCILVESLFESWKLKVGVMQHWVGWFDETEAEWEKVNV